MKSVYGTCKWEENKNCPLSPNPCFFIPGPGERAIPGLVSFFFLHNGCSSQGTAVPFSCPAPDPGGEPEKQDWAWKSHLKQTDVNSTLRSLLQPGLTLPTPPTASPIGREPDSCSCALQARVSGTTWSFPAPAPKRGTTAQWLDHRFLGQTDMVQGSV